MTWSLDKLKSLKSPLRTNSNSICSSWALLAGFPAARSFLLYIIPGRSRPGQCLIYQRVDRRRQVGANGFSFRFAEFRHEFAPPKSLGERGKTASLPARLCGGAEELLHCLGAVPVRDGPGAFGVPPHQCRVPSEPGPFVTRVEQPFEGSLQRLLGLEGWAVGPGEASAFQEPGEASRC